MKNGLTIDNDMELNAGISVANGIEKMVIKTETAQSIAIMLLDVIQTDMRVDPNSWHLSWVDGQVLENKTPVGDFYSFVVVGHDGKKFRVRITEDY